jgi:hypothetical protein
MGARNGSDPRAGRTRPLALEPAVLALENGDRALGLAPVREGVEEPGAAAPDPVPALLTGQLWYREAPPPCSWYDGAWSAKNAQALRFARNFARSAGSSVAARRPAGRSEPAASSAATRAMLAALQVRPGLRGVKRTLQLVTERRRRTPSIQPKHRA